ncbi:hypothetical protein E4K67_19650 [Desulfosporosinus fructosivorans]|uniref:Uncharacterized protein n=1 Tax=Desulfosporosinus fructosivorans TaxID=2018669 RepID=A0A4Z0R2R3_9FIRM|nr:hypothetical protein E4K67_19650 [Desulfosporosinus fructosivorans]
MNCSNSEDQSPDYALLLEGYPTLTDSKPRDLVAQCSVHTTQRGTWLHSAREPSSSSAAQRADVCREALLGPILAQGAPFYQAPFSP